MKNIKILLFIVPVLLLGCQNRDIDDVFEQTPDARVAAEIAKAKNLLFSNELGWLGHFEYNNGKAEDFFRIILDDGGRATIEYGELGVVYSSSTTYTLSYSMKLDLIFDTHSVFAELTNPTKGGDFRFELVEYTDDGMWFSTRNTEFQGYGDLILTPIKDTDQFPDLIELTYKMVNDPTKSFFRVLTMTSGNKYHFDVVSITKSFLEQLDADGVPVRNQYEIELTDEGYRFIEPVTTLEGEVITHFALESDGFFYAYNGTEKVGVLDYGNKAFTAKDNTDIFWATADIFSSSSYSYNMQKLIDDLKQYDNTFTSLQFYTYPMANLPEPYGLSEMLAIFRTAAAERWMQYFVKMEWGYDFMRINRTGYGTTSSNAYARDSRALNLLTQLYGNNTMGNYQDFNIVIRDGVIYLVQDRDPSIWMVVEPI